MDQFNVHFEEGLEKSLRAIDLARGANDAMAEVQARFSAVITLAPSGDLEGMRLHAEAMLDLAERLRDQVWLSYALAVNEIVASLEGDWRAARDYSDRGLVVSPQNMHLLHFRVLMEYEVGDFGQGEAYLEKLMEVIRLTPPGPTFENGSLDILIPAVARITGVADRFDIAERAAETGLTSPSAAPYPTTLARAGLALMAVERGDVSAASEQYAALASQGSTTLRFHPSIPKDLLGLLAQTIGKLDEAMGHFEDALAFCRKAGFRPQLAWTCCDYADCLTQRNGDGDREKTASLLDESLAISRELGMRPLMERVLSRREILGA